MRRLPEAWAKPGTCLEFLLNRHPVVVRAPIPLHAKLDFYGLRRIKKGIEISESLEFFGFSGTQKGGVRQAHNLKVAGSNPAPATKKTPGLTAGFFRWLPETGLEPVTSRDSVPPHNLKAEGR